MNLIFRFLRVLLAGLRRSRLCLLEESSVRFRVLPNDLDVNIHMNNGRYLALMDLGRMDLIARMGILGPMLRRRWRPVVGSLMTRFRRPLNPFQNYDLQTRVLGWDEKWFYMEQRFERGGETAAIAIVKGLFLCPDGRVSPAEVVALTDEAIDSPPLPAAIAEWQDAESTLLDEMVHEKSSDP